MPTYAGRVDISRNKLENKMMGMFDMKPSLMATRYMFFEILSKNP